MGAERPYFRRLRVFAVDPGMTAAMDTAAINEVILNIPWEVDADGNDLLKPGPIGEYVAVVDRDKSGAERHAPVDLDDPRLLSRSGLPASDGNPQFRQQMVYAVAMRTIGLFERALGRRAHWPQPKEGDAYIQRLELDPHSFDEANAYFHPESNRIRFGLFRSRPGAPNPGALVFTCLSQDVVSHEVAHGLLHGMHLQYVEPTNPDVFAFHEGFADIVALLLHFTIPEVLRYQITQARGDLTRPSELGVIARQFGQALGKKEGLRSFLGEYCEGSWRPLLPDPKYYRETDEPHARGGILVAAVMLAIQKIYKSRVGDLIRIATEGTGQLPEGFLHPDLVNRLAGEAADVADHVLQMCVRALDYCPSVDITFGDFLRAVITADFDLFPNDPRNYRVAFVDAFHSYGIFPAEVATLTLDGCLWPKPEPGSREESVVRDFVLRIGSDFTAWDMPHGREGLYRLMRAEARALEEELAGRAGALQGALGRIDLSQPFRIHSIWPRAHVGPGGEPLSQWVIEIVQEAGSFRRGVEELPRRAGCTLLADADSGLVRYAIKKDVGYDEPEPPKAGKGGGKTARARSDGKAKPRPESKAKPKPQPKSKPGPKGKGEGEQGKEAASGGEAGVEDEEDAEDRKVRLLLPVVAGSSIPEPHERRLRVFAFDPSMATMLETAGINEVTLSIPWEKRLERGPVGEYVEVIDRDPASDCFYHPVDLNDPYVLAGDGLTPSQSDPQFHQQMVYAVAMRTIRNFERALGRLALWSPRKLDGGLEDAEKSFVPRLRLCPHALREANAYYSLSKKAVLFGYFPVEPDERGAHGRVRSGAGPMTVFTCLSHDIIAHEVTHALLDGMHRGFAEPSNPDVHAFHEAFADLVALFQHFSLPDVLEHQIAATRGDLAAQNRLGELAQEFGSALGNHGALRSALGKHDESSDEWRPRKPDPAAYRRETEPHARGALLVATVFDAFLSIYRSRAADLFRIATRGTGVLPQGRLHPDLVRRLATEAAAAAQDVLDMCIRALDYCPPVDVTFGEFLRAVVTADHEHEPFDAGHRRVAFIEAFRRHGIYPEGVRSLSLDGLLWRQARAPGPDGKYRENVGPVLPIVRDWTKDLASWSLSRNRRDLFSMIVAKRDELTRSLGERAKSEPIPEIASGVPFKVHSLRPSSRVDRQGRSRVQWIIEIVQEEPEFLDPSRANAPGAEPDYYFRGGATLLVDAETGRIRYSIRKRLDDRARRERQRRYMTEVANGSLRATYFRKLAGREPFAVLHRF